MATLAQIQSALSSRFAAYEIETEPTQPNAGNPWGEDVEFFRVRAIETQGSTFRLVYLTMAKIGNAYFVDRDPTSERTDEAALQAWASHTDRAWQLCALHYNARLKSAMITVIANVSGDVEHHLVKTTGASSFVSSLLPDILERF
jgi:hypothetical protein